MKATIYHRRNMHPDVPMTMANLRKVATVEGEAPITVEELLERAFLLTQNAEMSWSAAPAPGVTPNLPKGEGERSTSVGDAVEIDAAWWLRTAAGWDRCETPGPAFVNRTAEYSGRGVMIIGAKPPEKT